MRGDVGIARAHRRVLIDLMAHLVGDDRVDLEVRRRAQYLQWALEGYEPGEQPLAFIADAPPLVPEAGEPGRMRSGIRP